MSAPVALSAMITAVQQNANIENQTGFITLPEIRRHINEYCAELWDLLIEARCQEHKRKSQTINMVQNTSAYPLASDFYQMISGDLIVSGAGSTTPQKYTLMPYMENERNMFQQYPSLAGWYMTFPCFYRIQGTAVSGGAGVSAVTEKVINFIPTPQSSFTAIVNYYPVFQPFSLIGTDDSSVFDGIQGWEAYVIWGASCNCKAKLKEDPTYCAAKLEAMKVRIQALAAQNDAGNAERVHDTMADYNTPFWMP